MAIQLPLGRIYALLRLTLAVATTLWPHLRVSECGLRCARTFKQSSSSHKYESGWDIALAQRMCCYCSGWMPSRMHTTSTIPCARERMEKPVVGNGIFMWILVVRRRQVHCDWQSPIRLTHTHTDSVAQLLGSLWRDIPGQIPNRRGIEMVETANKKWMNGRDSVRAAQLTFNGMCIGIVRRRRRDQHQLSFHRKWVCVIRSFLHCFSCDRSRVGPIEQRRAYVIRHYSFEACFTFTFVFFSCTLHTRAIGWQSTFDIDRHWNDTPRDKLLSEIVQQNKKKNTRRTVLHLSAPSHSAVAIHDWERKLSVFFRLSLFSLDVSFPFVFKFTYCWREDALDGNWNRYMANSDYRPWCRQLAHAQAHTKPIRVLNNRSPIDGVRDARASSMLFNNNNDNCSRDF